MGLDTTSVILHCYKFTVLLARKQFENNKHHTFNCIDYDGRMAKWFKALVSGTSHFHGMDLDATPVMLHCYKLTVLTTQNNLKIINNIPSTVINYICRMAEWSKGGFPVMAETTCNHIFSKEISQVIIAAMVLAPNFY